MLNTVAIVLLLQAPTPAAPDPELIERVGVELQRLERSALNEQTKSPREPALSSEIAFLLLFGLSVRAPDSRTLEKDEAELGLSIPSHSVKRRVLKLNPDAWIHSETAHVQDKSGSFSHSSLTLYVRQGVHWVKRGSGAQALSE